MRLRLDLAYDGTAFHGWAAQPSLRTVQGTVEDALRVVLRGPAVALTCAGRTDAGVHARGQVVHLDVDPDAVSAATARSAASPWQALRQRVNGVLPPDVRVHDCREASFGFDARFSALWRRYAYRIADSAESVDPLLRHCVVTWRRDLDLDAMNTAAARLLGEHDFAAFCRKREGATTFRTLLDCSWSRESDTGIAVASVRADAFCHSMVRALVGCLLAVGEGRRAADWPEQVLRARQRDPGVTVVPAAGLVLEKVAYPPDSSLAAQARAARVMRGG